MNKKKIFVDSDVVISSLISSKGAAHFLLNEINQEFIISDVSLIEIERGVSKLSLGKEYSAGLIRNKLRILKLKKRDINLEEIKADFRDYIFDEDDAHIVAGAKKSKAKIILSYNIRHFNKQKIKNDLGITVLTPAQYLQYLRSLE